MTLTGTFITVKAAIPHMIAAGNGGSITLTSSGAAITAGAGLGDYKAAKAGVIALMQTLACELAGRFIRVNAICPTAVDTPMIQNESLYRAFRPDLAQPGREDVKAGFAQMNLLCDVVVLTMGTGRADMMDSVLALAAKRGRVVVTNIYPMTDSRPKLALSGLAMVSRRGGSSVS